MNRLLVFFAIILLFAPLSSAQVREINLGSIFDAAKGVIKSRNVGSMSEKDEIAVGKEIGTLSSLYKTHPQASERIVDIESSLTQLVGIEPGSGAQPALIYKGEVK